MESRIWVASTGRSIIWRVGRGRTKCRGGTSGQRPKHRTIQYLSQEERAEWGPTRDGSRERLVVPTPDVSSLSLELQPSNSVGGGSWPVPERAQCEHSEGAAPRPHCTASSQKSMCVLKMHCGRGAAPFVILVSTSRTVWASVYRVALISMELRPFQRVSKACVRELSRTDAASPALWSAQNQRSHEAISCGRRNSCSHQVHVCVSQIQPRLLKTPVLNTTQPDAVTRFLFCVCLNSTLKDTSLNTTQPAGLWCCWAT